MDSEKHPDFLLFGGSRVGHGRGRDRQRQPRKKQLYPPLLLPWPARFKAPQVHLTVPWEMRVVATEGWSDLCRERTEPREGATGLLRT